MIFYFRGKLNFTNLDGNDIIETIKSAKHVTFDLQDVDYISSSFIRLCLVTSKTVGLKQLSIVNVNSFTLKLFHTTGLDKILDISLSPTLQHAQH